MKKEDIHALVETIHRYDDMQINHTFTKNYEDWINVRCTPGTRKIELTYLQSGKVEYYDSIHDAVDIICKNITSVVL